MLHTKTALSRAGCLLPLYSSSANATFKLCGSVKGTLTSSQYSTEVPRAKDIFTTSTPLIDEPVEKIHSQMAKLTSGANQKLKEMEKYSLRLAEAIEASTPKIHSAVFVGHVIEFAHRGNFEVGFVSGHSDNAITVSLVNDQTLKISPHQVVNVWSHEVGKVSFEDLKSLHEQLPSFLESQPIRKRDLSDAWKKICLFTQIPYTSSLLSKILFNSNSPLSVYATFRMMTASPYFKRWDNTSNGYKMYRADGLKGSKLGDFVQKIQQKLSGAGSGSELLPNWDRVTDTEFLGDLEAFARKGFALPKGDLATAKFVLQRVGKEFTPEASLALLQELGALSKNTREPFLNNAINPQAKEQANEILSFVSSLGGQLTNVANAQFPDLDSAARRDLTSHAVLAVDTDALAIDTGVSMHVSEDGQTSTIYLHVADPTRYLTPKDPISDAAYLSGSSLYFPNGTTHMLPTNFLRSTSLSNARENYCLTFALDVNTSTGELRNYQIFPSVIGRVTQVSYKNADFLLRGESKSENESHFTSLLQNLHMLKEARQANAPYRQLSAVPLQLDPTAKNGVTVSEHGTSQSFQALHYATVLADEAVSRLAKERDTPLPTQTNITRPLRAFSGMLSHWQIKAALRAAPLPFSNSEMDGMSKWLATKTTTNEQEIALKKDEWAQKALRTFYENQRKVAGDDTVFVIAKVLKKDPVKRTIAISVREFRYKSVLQLGEENYHKTETGGNVLLRMRERPTHIGMSFVSVMPSKPLTLDIPAKPALAEPEMEGPFLRLDSEPISTATLTNTARQMYSNRQSSIAGFPIPGISTRISPSVAARTPIRMFSATPRLFTDAKSAKTNLPPGMRIAQAQRGVTGDDFSDSAAPFEPYMFDLDPEDLLPRPPRIPVPPKPSRALKSRSRSMILNPIRREDDSTPLPEGSPTHIAIPAAVARAQAAAAAKAAAKEAKEAAKAAAKAAGIKETKTRKSSKDAKDAPAAAADAAAAPAADATPAGGAAPASAAGIPAAPHAVGPLGTTTPSASTTVGPAPTPSTPAKSFSIFSRPTFYSPLSLSIPLFPSAAVRTYARKKTPNDDVPEPKSDAPSTPVSTGTQSQKGKAQPPVADDEDEDEDAVNDDDEDEEKDDDEDDENEDDDENKEDEDEDDEGKDDDDEDENKNDDEDDDENKLQNNEEESDELDTIDAEDDELILDDDDDTPKKGKKKAKLDDDDEDEGDDDKYGDDDDDEDDKPAKKGKKAKEDLWDDALEEGEEGEEEGEEGEEDEDDLPKKFAPTDKKFSVSDAAVPLAAVGGAMAAAAAARAGTVEPPVTPPPAPAAKGAKARQPPPVKPTSYAAKPVSAPPAPAAKPAPPAAKPGRPRATPKVRGGPKVK